MTLSAHQINLCPYAGIFEKISQSDIFVMMSHCQYTKNNYQNRFYHKEKWHTMRCNQSHELIMDKKYLYPREDWMKITNELPKLKVFDEFVNDRLWLMNENIINKAVDLLNIKTALKYDWITPLTGTDRLIDFCKEFSADTYLSGVSGRNYLEMEKFEQANINVIFQQNPDKRALCEIL